MSLLKLQNISYKLGRRTLLSDLNLTLPEHGLTVLTGKNGAGKSTVAELIMGLHHPSSGDILYNSRSLLKLSITERARLGISLAFQTPPVFQGLKLKDIISDSNTLSLVGLPEEFLNRELDASLSGGERKRAELASVLSLHPKLLILDEPEAGIDLWTLKNYCALFSELKTSISLLIISHHPELLALADQKLVLSSGQIQQI